MVNTGETADWLKLCFQGFGALYAKAFHLGARFRSDFVSCLKDTLSVFPSHPPCVPGS